MSAGLARLTAPAAVLAGANIDTDCDQCPSSS